MKISSEAVELNIYFEPSELSHLANFAADQSITYLKTGRAANNPIHWKRDNGSTYILIGADINVWDIGFTFNEYLFTKIKLLLAK